MSDYEDYSADELLDMSDDDFNDLLDEEEEIVVEEEVTSEEVSAIVERADLEETIEALRAAAQDNDIPTDERLLALETVQELENRLSREPDPRYEHLDDEGLRVASEDAQIARAQAVDAMHEAMQKYGPLDDLMSGHRLLAERALEALRQAMEDTISEEVKLRRETAAREYVGSVEAAAVVQAEENAVAFIREERGMFLDRAKDALREATEARQRYGGDSVGDSDLKKLEADVMMAEAIAMQDPTDDDRYRLIVAEFLR